MADVQRLTLAEAARQCDHSPVSLRKAVQRGALRAERMGEGRRSTLYVTLADVQAYLEHRRTWRSRGTLPADEPDKGKPMN